MERPNPDPVAVAAAVAVAALATVWHPIPGVRSSAVAILVIATAAVIFAPPTDHLVAAVAVAALAETPRELGTAVPWCIDTHTAAATGQEGVNKGVTIYF